MDAALKKQSLNKESKNKEGRYVRVHADKLDDLINLVGELVVASSGANLLAQRSRDSQLQEANSTIAMLVEEIRDGALRLRMVPIGDTFNRFQRVVRDVSHELDKDIALVITGGDTELDKSVVEKIGDPLMHLVRNAMDHGIESAERRVAAGKPAWGTLTLNAYHDSGSIVIEIQDDGAGLNKARILQKAQERGLITTNATLTDQEIYQLIFEPGFSTAEAITNLSGRGGWHGCGQTQHPGPARQCRTRQQTRPRHPGPDPAAAHSGHHRWLFGARQHDPLRHPPRHGDRMRGADPERAGRYPGTQLHQSAR